jgi:hypothetical protein
MRRLQSQSLDRQCSNDDQWARAMRTEDIPVTITTTARAQLPIHLLWVDRAHRHSTHRCKNLSGSTHLMADNLSDVSRCATAGKTNQHSVRRRVSLSTLLRYAYTHLYIAAAGSYVVRQPALVGYLSEGLAKHEGTLEGKDNRGTETGRQMMEFRLLHVCAVIIPCSSSRHARSLTPAWNKHRFQQSSNSPG